MGSLVSEFEWSETGEHLDPGLLRFQQEFIRRVISAANCLPGPEMSPVQQLRLSK